MTDDRPPKSSPAVAEPDRLPIAVRAFAPPPPKPSGERSRKTAIRQACAAVRMDARLRHGNDRRRSAAACASALISCAKATNWTKPGSSMIRPPSAPRNWTCFERFASEQRTQAADRLGVRRRSAVCPGLRSSRFDCRLQSAVRHFPARDQAWLRSRQGHAGRLHVQAVPQWWRPAIQVRHLNARASLIQFTHPPKRRDPRGQRKRKIAPRNRRGSFIDLKTIAAALLSRSFSLASLADFLKTPTRKAESGGHGKQLTAKYRWLPAPGRSGHMGMLPEPCGTDMHCTRLRRRPLGKVLSEASLGKAYLKQMGVRPFREVQPDFPPHLTGQILSAYFGGRAEVHWRREIRQVLYCDFLSMYPTVCTLMGLWRFVIAQGMECVGHDRENPGARQFDFVGRIAAPRILAAADDNRSCRASSRHISGPRQIRWKIADHWLELSDKPKSRFGSRSPTSSPRNCMAENRRKLSRPSPFRRRSRKPDLRAISIAGKSELSRRSIEGRFFQAPDRPSHRGQGEIEANQEET